MLDRWGVQSLTRTELSCQWATTASQSDAMTTRYDSAQRRDACLHSSLAYGAASLDQEASRPAADQVPICVPCRDERHPEHQRRVCARVHALLHALPLQRMCKDDHSGAARVKRSLYPSLSSLSVSVYVLLSLSMSRLPSPRLLCCAALTCMSLVWCARGGLSLRQVEAQAACARITADV